MTTKEFVKANAGRRIKCGMFGYTGTIIGTAECFSQLTFTNVTTMLILLDKNSPIPGGQWPANGPTDTIFIEKKCDIVDLEKIPSEIRLYIRSAHREHFEFLELELSPFVAGIPEKRINPFPHVCPKCQSPAYIGFTSFECSGKCRFQ